MPAPRSYRCEALTLKRHPLGEADLLVTLYTRDRGKLRAMAKGSRRPTSKLVGHLEPLTQVSLSLAQGRNLDFITQVQVVGNHSALKGDLKSIAKGLYVAELLDGFGAEASPN
ncbi:MAG: DNA repair protein RecO, partial [Chloroflexota bacterium]